MSCKRSIPSLQTRSIPACGIRFPGPYTEKRAMLTLPRPPDRIATLETGKHPAHDQAESIGINGQFPPPLLISPSDMMRSTRPTHSNKHNKSQTASSSSVSWYLDICLDLVVVEHRTFPVAVVGKEELRLAVVVSSAVVLGHWRRLEVGMWAVVGIVDGEKPL